MNYFIFLIGCILPSGVFAQVKPAMADYQAALKKLDSVKVLCPDSIIIPPVKEMDRNAAACEYLHLETVAAFRYEAAHIRDREELKPRMEKLFGMPFDSIQHLGRQFGDDYLVWLYARHLLPPEVQERYLLHRLDWYAKEEWLSHARRFLGDLEYYFPRSRYMNEAKATVRALESKVAAGKNNAHIVFRSAVPSFNELVAPYKGKVVYLDIWGTWCGPCREEMNYVAALKQHVDTAKVAFLYLDEDADENDRRWREYVQLKSIAGEHVRMNEQDMEVIWEVLLHTSHVARYYPSFFIFGKDGRLVQANAKRPSDKEALYLQLREAIDEP